MRFNIEDYPGTYVMHCKTLIEAKSFCAYLNGIGKTWSSGTPYIGREQWLNNNEEHTGYRFNTGEYGNVNYYKDIGYTILEWSDFMYDTPAGKIDDRNDYDLNIVFIDGVDWIKLPEENGVIPIIAKDHLHYTDFDYNNSPYNNNFATSELFGTLNTGWLSRMETILGADNIVEFETDLTSVFGETDYGTMRSKISLPTFEMYKKHHKIFLKHFNRNECFWSATPWTTLNTYEVCLISGHTYINPESPRNAYNVHPVMYVKASALTIQN